MNFNSVLENRNCSKTMLANMTGLSISSISRYSKNERTPTFQTMQKLAEALEVDLQTIIECFVQDSKKSKKE